MSEYEPDDSRIVTNSPSQTPIEPKRTGPQEGETRKGDEKAARQQEQPAASTREAADERERWQAGDGENAKEEQGE